MKHLTHWQSIFIVLLFCANNFSFAQNVRDSLTVSHVNKHEEKNRNVMLNASSSSKPREISIGLPGQDSGTCIYEDGMPVASSNWPAYPYFHWVGGNSYASQTLLKMEDVALRSSDIGYAINSITRLGDDHFNGIITASTSSFGLMRFDGNVNGPLGHDYYYTVGAYLNLDPTSTHPSSKRYINNMQLFKFGITKKWNDHKGEASLLYKLSVNNDGAYGYASAPFYYVGDGSIRKYKGFKLGNNCYFSDDDKVEYRNVVDNTQHSDRLGKMNTKVIHDVMLKSSYQFDNGWILNGSFHMSGSKGMNNLGIYETGIDLASPATSQNTMVYPNGTSFSGYLQNMLGILVHADYLDLMENISMKNKLNKHDMEIGLCNWYDYQYQLGSTFKYAHTVENNPLRLSNNGKSTWGYNDCGEYYKGHQNITALYAIDDWTPNDKLDFYYGLRLELMDYHVKAAVNMNGEKVNTRYEGFYIDNGITRLHNINHTRINPVALLNLSYRIFGKLYFSGELLYTQQHKRITNFAAADMPIMKPNVTRLERFGVIYDNKWLSITSMLSLISSEHNTGMLHFTKQIGGVSETQASLVSFDIGTLGWTTDIATSFSNFNLHFLTTFQSPEYNNFKRDLTFSDGSSQTIDYDNNYVTGISRVLLEIDPSYQLNQWNFWFSIRYFSKQYANRVNNAYFNGHWETFAGINYQMSKKLSLSTDIVNLLNQTGANGTLDVADTITDSTQLENYLTSGTYIRPLTVNMSIRYTF